MKTQLMMHYLAPIPHPCPFPVVESRTYLHSLNWENACGDFFFELIRDNIILSPENVFAFFIAHPGTAEITLLFSLIFNLSFAILTGTHQAIYLMMIPPGFGVPESVIAILLYLLDINQVCDVLLEMRPLAEEGIEKIYAGCSPEEVKHPPYFFLINYRNLLSLSWHLVRGLFYGF